ncbi:hypothetical protein JNW88_00415 [Micromonospora sp. ATA32]|nr:hypothetical protein [Micromonospora sp. ATA32]
MGKYDDMTADKLREQASKRDLPTSGTKPELVARLDAADAEQATTDTAKANPLLADDRTINVDETLAFAGRVRALADEIGEQLTKEVVEPLTDFEATVSDPRSGVVTASTRRVRGTVDDLQRDLRILAAAAGAMGQDALR